MQILYAIEKAGRLIDRMTGPQRQALLAICGEIQVAQQRLNHAAKPYFLHCIRQCEGICCKNIHINEIVNILDFIYILTLAPDLQPVLKQLATKEGLFSADCFFLQDGVGPCVFPPDIKPERCILTFCSDTTPINRDIKWVRSRFSRLSRYTTLRRPFFWIGI